MQQSGQISLPSVLTHQQPPDRSFFFSYPLWRKHHARFIVLRNLSNWFLTEAELTVCALVEVVLILRRYRLIDALVKPSQVCLSKYCQDAHKDQTISSMSTWNQFWTWHASSNQATLQHINGNLVTKTYTKSWVWGERRFLLWIWNRKRVYAVFQD